MSYSQFSLPAVVKKFELKIIEKVALFNDVVALPCSISLKETLDYNVPLAVSNNTEKARSEMIVTPILIELKKNLATQISLFSGVEFNVDAENGLVGFCDFIISHSSEQLFVNAPIIMLVEAKNDNIKNGLGQCIAEMLAAQLFNQQEQNNIQEINGVVTTGTIWQFMRLKDKTVEIDLNEYHLPEIDKILGILSMSLNKEL
ncbi:MAG: hypothetical protein KAG43_05795 [Candidatus Marithrix sp.]|nr:hypothetical protein [Candidatus Marithrix sp.]